MSTNNKSNNKGWTPEQLGNLDGKTFVITGANSGAGFQASRILLSKGAKVVMLNRNEKKSDVAIRQLKVEFGDDAKVSYFIMDLAVMASGSKRI
ncbi:SDR family NAD(P)-dependent oxidoreductase [Psychromonas sp. KJ10-10]|uniref:SDR family NAD(P)-dependent oxidoreductase n=1 Tax=Psychromonas sp. KJ10-10 TaxID=3391823 RepID=UPI0039B58C1C